jgi:hypothetical protein
MSLSNIVGREARRVDVSAGVALLARPPRRQRWPLRLPPPISVPRLLATDIVEGIEDIQAVLEGVCVAAI